MRILYIITRAEMGGGQTHVLDLLRGFSHTCTVELATGETGFLTDATQKLGIPVHIMPHLVQPISPLDDLRALGETVALLRKTRPSLIHAHTSKAGMIARAAARITGTPCVFTAHTWCFAEGTSWKWKMVGTPLERLAARWSASVINVSNANRELALKQSVGDVAKHVTVHNGIADSPLRAAPGIRTVPRILMLARFAPQKAQSLLLDAVHDIALPFELVFVGDGPQRAQMEAKAEALGLSGKVKFLGQRMDISELMAGSHIFALFTHWEGFPISILEAMRAGLPSVVSNVGGNSEAIDASCGDVIAPGDVAGFRQGLLRLLADPALRAKLGAAARRRYQAEFTQEIMLKKTMEVYSAAVGIKVRKAAPSPGTKILTIPGGSSYSKSGLPTDS